MKMKICGNEPQLFYASSKRLVCSCQSGGSTEGHRLVERSCIDFGARRPLRAVAVVAVSLFGETAPENFEVLNHVTFLKAE